MITDDCKEPIWGANGTLPSLHNNIRPELKITKKKGLSISTNL